MRPSVSAAAAGDRRAPRWRPLVAACLLATAACAGMQPPPQGPSADRIPELRSRVEASPDAVEPRVRLGAAYRADGQLEEARAVLEEALRLDPGHPRASLFLGLTHEDLERWSDARDVYRDYLAAAGETEMAGRIEARLAYLDRRELEASLRQALDREAELADRPPRENTVAVFPYLYRGPSPEFRPLSRAMAAFLVTDLACSDRITVLERMRVQLLLQEMELSESRYVDPSTAVRSGRLLGSSRIVQGVISGDEERLEVETSLVDTRDPSAEEASEPVFTGGRSAPEILDLETEIAFALFESLGVELTAAERRAVRDRPTESLEAMMAFGRGLIAEDSANYEAAAAHYRRAGELDPGFEAAAERADRASDLSAAAGQSTDGLARAAYGREREAGPVETGPAPDLVEGLVGRGDFGLARDPAAEVLGVEGVSGGAAVLRILIPPPGGGLR